MTYKPKVHQKYLHPITGEFLPGATTICGRHPDGKGAMLGSAVKLTKEGTDYRALWDFKAQCGTCTHDLVQHHILRLGTPSKDHWTPAIWKRAQVGLRAFKRWERVTKPLYVGSELVVINAEHGYGGSVDIWAVIDGAIRVVDIKTGGWWATAEMQIVAYDEAIYDELFRNDPEDFPMWERGEPQGLQLDLDGGSYTVHHLMRPTIIHRWAQFRNLLEGWQLDRSG